MMGLGTPELLILVVVMLIGLGVVLLVVLVAQRAGRRPAVPRPLPDVPVSADLQTRVRTLAAEGQKILAIKELREATGLSLLDAKNTVEAIAAGAVRPVPGPAPRADLAHRARTLAAAGREPDAVTLVTTETGMSAPEARAFLHSLLGP